MVAHEKFYLLPVMLIDKQPLQNAFYYDVSDFLMLSRYSLPYVVKKYSQKEDLLLNFPHNFSQILQFALLIVF